MIKEFKEFAVKGNAVELAIGVIIGSAFGKIVDSIVTDIIMPPFSLVFGKVDFSNLYVTLSGNHYPTLAAAKAAGAVTINYGQFINTSFNFLIISFVIFILVQQIYKFRRNPKAVPNTKTCPYCFTVIHLSATRCPACTAALPSKT